MNIENMKVFFARLFNAGLNVNAPKWSFGLNQITYLGYVITQDGIKTDPKKVQGVMDLGEPSTTT